MLRAAAFGGGFVMPRLAFGTDAVLMPVGRFGLWHRADPTAEPIMIPGPGAHLVMPDYAAPATMGLVWFTQAPPLPPAHPPHTTASAVRLPSPPPCYTVRGVAWHNGAAVRQDGRVLYLLPW